MSDVDYDDTDEVEDNRSAGSRFRDWCWETVRTWGPALLAVLLIRSVLAEPFRIPSGSMVPTLAIGDHIVVTKFTYGLRIPLTRIPVTEIQAPERGDVVVFVYPGSDEGKASYWMDMPFPPFHTHDYVKRVVGLPGDAVEVRNNTVYINDEAQTKTYREPFEFVDDRCHSSATKRFTEQFGDGEHEILNATHFGLRMGDFGPETVPEGHIFAMGDNRDHSSDSRVWGFVPFRNIKGKAQLVWLSYDMCKQNEPGAIPIFGKFRGHRFGEPVL